MAKPLHILSYISYHQMVQRRVSSWISCKFFYEKTIENAVLKSILLLCGYLFPEILAFPGSNVIIDDGIGIEWKGAPCTTAEMAINQVLVLIKMYPSLYVHQTQFHKVNILYWLCSAFDKHTPLTHHIRCKSEIFPKKYKTRTNTEWQNDINFLQPNERGKRMVRYHENVVSPR